MHSKILVVDDLPDVRSTVGGILRDEGYLTRAASSREEALAILENERFHIAVLDVRLDESDEDNREGMELLQQINKSDPAITVIMLTGYADAEMVREALQPMNGRQPAYSVVFKQEMTRLPQTVRGAFQESLRLNLGLVVEDPQDYIEQLSERIRFPEGKSPAKEDTSLQTREIFCKLFFECEKIHLTKMQQGFNGAAVFQVTPTYQGKGEGQGVVVKIGNRDDISAEISNYEKYVKGVVGGHRIPEALRSASTRHASGILYSFIGLGDQTENFACFYQSNRVDELLPVLNNIYRETLFPLKDKTGRLKENCDLREFYLRQLRLNDEKLQRIATGIGAGQSIFTERADGAWQFGTERLPNPLRYARGASFRADGFFTTIHGDLNGQNILLDAHHATWLIDFLTTTDDGHILQDYAALETHLRFRLAPESGCNFEMLLQWTRGCFTGSLLAAPFSPAAYDHPGLLKAHRVLQHIRTLAAQTSGYSERAHLIALFFNSLHAATYQEASDFTRNHALYCAAKIAQRLNPEKDTPHSKIAQVVIVIEKDILKFTEIEQNNIVSAISELSDISISHIRILHVAKGSVVITLEMPEVGAKRLMELYYKNGIEVEKLGIRKISFTMASEKKETPTYENTWNILFLAAEPAKLSHLDLGKEAREIRERLQLSKYRDNFAVNERWAIRSVDISQAMLDLHPQIVHFSGHGESSGAICFENQIGEMQPVNPDALSSLFEQFAGQVKVVILNACYSEQQAIAISQKIGYVIGMKKDITDAASIAFSVGFYQAIGAGKSVVDAFKLGVTQIRLQGFEEHGIPVLLEKDI